MREAVPRPAGLGAAPTRRATVPACDGAGVTATTVPEVQKSALPLACASEVIQRECGKNGDPLVSRARA
jgi:hypothetical protein